MYRVIDRGLWIHKVGSEVEFVDTEQSEVYLRDTFGLKSMDDRGDLVVKVVKGVAHMCVYGGVMYINTTTTFCFFIKASTIFIVI